MSEEQLAEGIATNAPLVIWTASSYSAVRDTFAAALKRLKKVPDHAYHEFSEHGEPPVPAPGGVVLVCGDAALKQLGKFGKAPKNRTVTSLREKPIPCEGGWYLVTFSPAVVYNEPHMGAILEWDTILALRLIRTGGTKPVIPPYQWVNDYGPMIEEIKAEHKKTGKKVSVAMDTETMSFFPWYPDRDMISISFTHKPGEARVLYLGPQAPPIPYNPETPLFAQIEWLLTSPIVKLKGANLKYDLVWIKEKWDIDCTNFVFDSMLVGSLLDENRSNSLNVHTKVMVPELGGYDDSFNHKYDKGKMEAIPAEGDLLTYAGGDTDACYRVCDVLLDELVQDGRLTDFYTTVLHPAARAFEKIEARGLCIDKPKFMKLRSDLKQTIAGSQESALGLLPVKMRLKHRDRIDEQIAEGKNPLLPSIMKDYFFSPGGLGLKPKVMAPKPDKNGNPVPSMAKSHLRMFADNIQAKTMVDTITTLDVASKALSTFVDGFLEDLRPDGKFHATYFLAHASYEGRDEDSGTTCTTADTLFVTSRGVIPYTQLCLGDQVISHEGIGRRITDLLDNGTKPVYRVTLNNGMSVDCTGNHPFRTGTSWTTCDLLYPGLSVAVMGNAEAWKPVADWPFEVSNWGRVRSAKGTILQQYPKGAWGHLKVCLFRNGAQKRGEDRRDFAVHRLVAQAFLPNYTDAPEVRHVNGIAWDNRPENMCWGTRQQNAQDTSQHMTNAKHEHPSAKLNWEIVGYLRASSKSDIELAEQFDVSRELVRDVRAFKRWVERAPAGTSVAFGQAFVVSTEYIGDLPTFGVTVDEAHSHVTNGIVTHNTGRLSAKNPAIQLIPKKHVWAKRIRECYIAPDGRQVMNLDYSQGELKIVACVAGEKNMLAAYKQGLDLHAVTGARLAEVDFTEFMTWKGHENPELAKKFDSARDRAKPANFGLLYGMSPEGFQAYAWAAYGLKLTLDEATQIHKAFFSLYPGLLGYHDSMRSFVNRYGYVRSPLGRIRHLPHVKSRDRAIRAMAERQAINSPIQSTLSDMMLWAIATLQAELGDDLSVVAMIHDAIICYPPTERVVELGNKARNVMANLPLHQLQWEPELQFTADAEFGPNLASLQKLPKAA